MTAGAPNDLLNIVVKNVGTFQVARGSTVGELCASLQEGRAYPIVAVIIKNTLRDLHYIFRYDCNVELVDTTCPAGLRIYRRSATMVLLKACRDLFPERTLMVKHTLSNGLYCEFLEVPSADIEIDLIQNRMRQIVQQDLPIKRHLMENDEVRRIFMDQGQNDKVQLMRYRDKEAAHVYELDGYVEYPYGYMTNRTGILGKFSFSTILLAGLRTPEIDDLDLVKPYREQRKLAMIHQEAKEWADMLHVPHVSALNDMITQDKIDDLIRVNEALHEKKIAYIADTISDNPSIRVVLIAGPSSSGKTTFAQRLLIQLRVIGHHPVSISMDNYFVDRANTPIDEEGNYDYDSLAAVDIDLFNEQLTRLIEGEDVEMPIYNFKTGRREETGTTIRVPTNEPIIVEGIHALNDQLTWSVPVKNKFKIYISALTQLNVDYSNRIPTTDSRLIRRIVRDHRTRGNPAIKTIKQWPSVRRAEEKNIFAFQENANVMFNSSLVYEMAALKLFAEPLLEAIDNDVPEHIESSRLLRFLSYFRAIPTTNIPPNSILREFVGGSWFDI